MVDRAALLRSVLTAVVVSPFLVSLIATALRLVRWKGSLPDMATILVGVPIIGAVFLFLGGIPVFIGTAAVVSALTFVQRQIWSSPILLWAVAAASIAAIPYFLSRYPNGDGGSMQSMVESFKAMFATSVAIWCIITALRPGVRI